MDESVNCLDGIGYIPPTQDEVAVISDSQPVNCLTGLPEEVNCSITDIDQED